jgi:CHASE3 domain sensor protein
MRPAWWPPAKPRVTPEEINAARRARETARAAAQAAAQQTRRLVLAIWAVAFTLGIGLAVAAISS